MEEKKVKRSKFSSNLGMMLACIGGAVGLGNVWGFPSKLGRGGGFYFLIIYVVVALLLGIPMTLSEYAIGRKMRKGPIAAWTELNRKWKFVGILNAIVCVGVMGFYCLLFGWIIKYMVEFGIAIFNPASTFWTMDSAEYFSMFISNPVEPLVWTFVGLLLAYLCVRKNMAGGIEKACKWMIPALVVLLIVVAIRACTLPGAEAGIEFLFQPSTENVMTSGGWLTVFGIALAQMFFSLNVGFGTNLMYGSYAPDDSDLAKNALLVPLGDMVVALLAALATIPAAFAFGYSPSTGAGMLFITMKAVFESMPGGAIFGLAVGMVADLLFESLRSFGWETTTSRILMELFLPFILYLGAEAVHVSGILSVVTAGLIIRFDRTGIGPNVARTNIVSSSVWGVFSFTLNGTVFILLGMLLPNAMSASWDDPQVSNWLLLVAILTVSAVVIIMRFLWISLMLRLARDTVTGKRRKMTAQRWRSAAVMTFGGPKGTITLSLMFTIPYTITGGAWFPMRDELIFIAGGVIVVTLLLANFLLPLLAPNRNKDTSVEMIEITIEVLRRTVEELTGRVTPDNRRAVLMIIDSYTKRITRLKQRIGEIDPQGYMQLQIDALNWEKEYVKARLAKVKATPNDDKAAHDLEIEACERLLDQIMSSLRHIETEHNSGRTIWRVKGRFRALQRRLGTVVKRVNSRIRRTTPLFSDDELFAHTRAVQVDAIEHVIDRLYEEMGRDTYNTEHCSALLLDYRRGEATLRSRPNVGTSAEAQAQAEEVKRESYGIELGVIQDMYEAGDITRAQSKQLRRNVYVMSVDADAQI